MTNYRGADESHIIFYDLGGVDSSPLSSTTRARSTTRWPASTFPRTTVHSASSSAKSKWPSLPSPKLAIESLEDGNDIAETFAHTKFEEINNKPIEQCPLTFGIRTTGGVSTRSSPIILFSDVLHCRRYLVLAVSSPRLSPATLFSDVLHRRWQPATVSIQVFEGERHISQGFGLLKVRGSRSEEM
ncbi:hypothetical protein M407DRAFT_244301 [Tulasnella calospora MUT 4182]|uniref:Uncharacterized protein n=1 Tax=Tulasnella calospora MUT 4182 TaxID=1051891 RepID=A0A0C3QFB3_9AGAM|nr:hypothetical protein M407DRAFT_244301 [Tulasnella calospora MUT 4182]